MLNVPAATPPGALDLTGDAARRRRALQRAAVEVLERAGYEELLPPTFEYEDTFLRAGGTGVAERLLRFPDRDGRVLALRYDFTSSVARIAATTFAGARLPLRLSYSGRVYRQEPERGGRPRETLQVGAELLGDGSLEADVEIVRLMIEGLQPAGIERLHVDLGNPAIYRSMAADLEPDNAEELFHAVQQKDAVRAGPLAVLTTLNGGAEVLARARSELPARVQPMLQSLETLAQKCAAPGVEISFDLAELGGFNYESGLVFAAFAPGSPDAIARGGRYDEVGVSFGRARPATGFTMDLRQLAGLARGAAKRSAILAPCSDDETLRELVARLRAQGEVVIVALPGHDPAELACTRRIEMREGKWHVT